jgi:hypothetical protein
MVYPVENYVEKIDGLVFISPDRSDPKWTFEKPDRLAKIAVSKEGEGAQYVIMFSDKQIQIVPRKLEETSEAHEQQLQTIFKWIVLGLKQIATERGLTSDNINALNLEVIMYSPIQYTMACAKKQVTESYDAFGYTLPMIASQIETHNSYMLQYKGFTEYKFPLKLQSNLTGEVVITGTDGFKSISYKFKTKDAALIYGQPPVQPVYQFGAQQGFGQQGFGAQQGFGQQGFGAQGFGGQGFQFGQK